ncbi:MAG: hypothetical protein DMD33_19075 [Gemmatimonadetes bacterium]|nr:MAG: hypothetical protein DMD33_19075 [Gemmatimonadota bacterium]PYO76553.1 MAG: hypothetical protein DMD67_08190 [Gemmatimonadota bacterium]TLY53808.1 MAG: hypothetical protein E6K55_07300 [Gemmatimonadota bacterium]
MKCAKVGLNSSTGNKGIQMTGSITVNLPDALYERRLRVLAAWWCLGSSALEPQLLMQYEPVPPAHLRLAGL